MDMRAGAQHRSSFEWGILWMLLSATCLSISFLFLKINLSFINYYFLLFLRFFVPLILVIGVISISRKWKGIFSLKHIGLQLARALCVIVSQYGIAFYISANTLLNATVLLNSAPLFIPLIEWIFLKRRPGKSTIWGALLAFFGVILVLNPDRSLFSAMSGIGLIAALGQAGSQVLYGIRSRNENLSRSLFYLFLFTSSFALLVFLVRGENLFNFTAGNIQLSDRFMLIAILLMGGGTLLNQYFRGLAYRCGNPSTLATFLFFSVFVSAIFDWLIFETSITALSVIGSCLIIMGGVLKIFLRARILKKRAK
jgi:drug/metabolite transporter (DMT)-like permease